jgi:uncharacterized protein YgiM (DUF1202 family)
MIGRGSFTSTATPNEQETLDAMIAATDTAVAISRHPTGTPSSTNTQMPVPTAMLRPTDTPYPTATTTTGPLLLHVGGQARVYVEDEGLKLRSGPTITNRLVENLPSGTIVTIIGGPQRSGGYIWWNLLSPNGNRGWAVEAADGIVTLIPIS